MLKILELESLCLIENNMFDTREEVCVCLDRLNGFAVKLVAA